MKTIRETPRLRLRHACAGDAAWLLALMNEPAYLENIGDRGLRTVDDAQTYIARTFEQSYRDNGHGLYVVETRDEITPVGLCGLVRRDALPYPDIGFAFLAGSGAGCRGAQRGWNAMIPMPTSATATPATSHGVGRTPSTAHSQAKAIAMYMPP